MKRRTKIICTIGPATASFEGLKALYEAGMNIVDSICLIRTMPVPLKLSTGSKPSTGRWIIRTDFAGYSGPEIRTGVLDNPMELNPGDVVTLSVRDGELVEQRSIHVNYTELVDVVEVEPRYHRR